MSTLKPIDPSKSRPLAIEPCALRHRGGLTGMQAALTAMAIDDDGRLAISVEHRVDIQRTHYTSTGARYRVTYLDKTLIESARDPEFEACRALLAKGIKGRLVTYSPGSTVPRMRVDIEKGAKLMTIDSATDGPRIGRYRPHPSSSGRDYAE